MGILPQIDDAPYNQRSDFCLYHRTEVLRSQQSPAAAVEDVDGILFTGDRLDAVERAGDITVLPLVSIVYAAVVVIIGWA